MAVGRSSNNVSIRPEGPVSKVNRLILLGNGFDLAHGYKTRYSDFLFEYLYEIVSLLVEGKAYKDELVNAGFTSNYNRLQLFFK